MISKEEAKAKLRKAGYSVVDDNAVVTVLVSEKSNIKNIVKDVKELLLKADYDASFGIKQTNASLEDSVEDSSEESVDETDVIDVDSNDSNSLTAIDDNDDSDTIKEEAPKKKETSKRAKKAQKKEESEEFFDDEDDDIEGASSEINLDAFDMDMLLNEDSVQFSLEDFGMM